MRRVAFLFAVCLLSSVTDGHAQGVRGFGPPRGKLPLRGFGNPAGEEALRRRFPEAAAAVIGEDWGQALGQIAKTDGNGDGIVTQEEWTASGYQNPRQFYYNDLNHDGKITLYEQTLGFAAWRRRNERRADSRESARRASLPKPDRPPSTAALQTVPDDDPQRQAREQETQELAAYMLRVYDLNQNDIVDREEFKSSSSPFGNLGGADHDGDGRINRRELAAWLKKRLPPLPASQLAINLQSRDADKDGQVALREFASQITPAILAEFDQWDRNGDGFITADESQQTLPQVEADYVSGKPMVLKPNAVIISPIAIEEDFVIGDVDVRLALAKEYDQFTEVHLIAPDGTRVTLYAGGGWRPWNGGYILDQIVFDDDAPRIEQTLRTPPYPRALRPPGSSTDDESSLSDMRGLSARGVWRLVVRNQNDRGGLLNRWSLHVTPREGKR